jgi:hypothetical protein
MAQRTWPDGTPRRGPDDMGSVGGVAPNGQAVRHADGLEPPRENFGWLNGSPAAKSDPQGTPYTPIGPGSKVWGTPQGKFTTGMQRGGKPRR